MVSPVEILKDLVDDKLYNILELIVRNNDNELYLKRISEESKVSMASAYRILKQLIALSYIREVKIGPAKIYRLNDNKKTKILKEWFKEKSDPLAEFVKLCSLLEGIKKIILHNEPTDSGAEVIVIGTNINLNKMNSIAQSIFQRYNYKIKILPLTEEQYKQMGSLNMISGIKKPLWSKEDDFPNGLP